MKMGNDYNKVIITSRLSNTKSVIAAITTLVICCALFFFLPQFIGDNQYVRQVKGGCPSTYPSITYEDAFGQFYGSPRWGYVKGNNGSDIVTFTGNCQYDGKPASVELRFQLNSDNTFNLIGGSINGVEQNILVLAMLNSTPFEEYKK